MKVNLKQLVSANMVKSYSVTFITQKKGMRSFIITRKTILLLGSFILLLAAGFMANVINNFIGYKILQDLLMIEEQRIQKNIDEFNAYTSIIGNLSGTMYSSSKHLYQKLPYNFEKSDDENIYVSATKKPNDEREDQKAISSSLMEQSLAAITELSDYLYDLVDNSNKMKMTIEQVNAIPDGLPVAGWLASGFGLRKSPFGNTYQFHRGLDIANEVNTSIVTGGNGTVVFSGTKYLWGKTVIIDHDFGVRTQYGHLNTLLVKKGQRLDAGDVIGTLGNTGRSTGPHLHYQIRVDNVPYDPLLFITKENQTLIENLTTASESPEESYFNLAGDK